MATQTKANPQTEPTYEFLTERRMKAADAILYRPRDGCYYDEVIEVALHGAGGTIRLCRLVCRGDKPGTVKLSIWSVEDRIMGNRDIRFEEVEVFPDVAARLDSIADAQDSKQTPAQTLTARQQAQAFIAWAKAKQRGQRVGRWADGRFRSRGNVEKAGRL